MSDVDLAMVLQSNNDDKVECVQTKIFRTNIQRRFTFPMKILALVAVCVPSWNCHRIYVASFTYRAVIVTIQIRCVTNQHPAMMVKLMKGH